jgi:hypothetical protein
MRTSATYYCDDLTAVRYNEKAFPTLSMRITHQHLCHLTRESHSCIETLFSVLVEGPGHHVEDEEDIVPIYYRICHAR